MVVSKPAVKYLSVFVDDTLSFREKLEYVWDSECHHSPIFII